MNITHITEEQMVDGPKSVKELLAFQKKLQGQYVKIEQLSGLGYGLVQGTVFHIDDRAWQYLIKDFCWRVTEEIAEAIEAHDLKNHDAFIEELVDALHFLIETYIKECLTLLFLILIKI